jgi:uncharacterized membrane protein YccC
VKNARPIGAETNAELAIALPLGVVANQLMKVETDLRFLSTRSGAYAHRDQSGIASQVAARLERIHESLDSIRRLIAALEADLQPKASSAPPSLRPRDNRSDRNED